MNMLDVVLKKCEDAHITLLLDANGAPTWRGKKADMTENISRLLKDNRAIVLAHLQAQQPVMPAEPTPIVEPEPEATDVDDDEPAAELWHPAVAITLVKYLATEIRTWRAVGGTLAHSLGSTIARMAGDGFERQDMQWIRAAGAMLEDARGFWRDVIWPDVGTVKELQAVLLATPSANPGELPIEGPSHYVFDDSGDEGEAA